MKYLGKSSTKTLENYLYNGRDLFDSKLFNNIDNDLWYFIKYAAFYKVGDFLDHYIRIALTL